MIRHLADELHVDPRQVRGTGPGGRVHRDDVEAAAHHTTRPRITPRARRLLSEAPGVEVIDDPALMVDGGDPQLDAAIEHMLDELKKNPYIPAKRPPAR